MFHGLGLLPLGVVDALDGLVFLKSAEAVFDLPKLSVGRSVADVDLC